jgi:hypothetical protein
VSENIAITFDAKFLSTFPFLHSTLSFLCHLEDAGSLNLSDIFSIPTTTNLTLVLLTKLVIFEQTLCWRITYLFIYLFKYAAYHYEYQIDKFRAVFAAGNGEASGSN